MIVGVEDQVGPLVGGCLIAKAILTKPGSPIRKDFAISHVVMVVGIILAAALESMLGSIGDHRFTPVAVTLPIKPKLNGSCSIRTWQVHGRGCGVNDHVGIIGGKSYRQITILGGAGNDAQRGGALVSSVVIAHLVAGHRVV